MAKIIKSKNAQLFFTLSHGQFANGKITRYTYVNRLRRLVKHIDQRSSLYAVICDIIWFSEELPIYPLAKYDKSFTLDEGYKIIMERVRMSGQLMEFKQIGNMRIADTDDLPSIPHIHLRNSNEKIDIYTGICTDDTALSDKDFVNLWNDEEFFKKLYSNRHQLMFV